MPFAICITKCIPAGNRAGKTLGIPRVLEWRMARSGRFELPTPRFVVWCSIQLSYERIIRCVRLHGRLLLRSVATGCAAT